MLEQNSAEGVRIVFLPPTLLLCILLASAMAQNGVLTGLFKKKPSVELQASKTLIALPCPPDGRSISGSCPSTVDLRVALTAIAKDSSKQPVYSYSVTGGRIVGEGSKVTWDLNGVWPGFYTATVEVQDNKKHRAVSSVIVKIVNCSDCVISDGCPTIVVTCYDEVKAGTPITCKVVVWAGPWSNLITYEWSARGSSGEDFSGRISGQGASISIPTSGLAGQTVYVTVEVKGLDLSCSSTSSSSARVKP